MIATDVGSRGLDIPEVAVVVNWEVPRVPDDYIHRVGRTARAGRTGTSVTFVTEGDVELVQALEERIGTKLEGLELPEEPVLELLNAVSIAKRMANMVRLSLLSLLLPRTELTLGIPSNRLWLLKDLEVNKRTIERRLGSSREDLQERGEEVRVRKLLGKEVRQSLGKERRTEARSRR